MDLVGPWGVGRGGGFLQITQYGHVLLCCRLARCALGYPFAKENGTCLGISYRLLLTDNNCEDPWSSFGQFGRNEEDKSSFRTQVDLAEHIPLKIISRHVSVCK